MLVLKRNKKKKMEADKVCIEFIRQSGIFDVKWYRNKYSNLLEDHEDPIEHYYFKGADLGLNPLYLFDTKWYKEQNSDVSESEINPLYHYLCHGESEGRSPSVLFDVKFVAAQLPNNITLDGSVLRFFLDFSSVDLIDPVKEFSTSYYLESYPDIKDAGVDPYLHFLQTGVFEGRNPSPSFDVPWYKSHYSLDGNVFVHFLTEGQGKGLDCAPPRVQDMPEKEGGAPVRDSAIETSIVARDVVREIEKYRKPGEGFEEFAYSDMPVSKAKVKALAYYLPQFHPFKENSEWWGEGFTEWTNVTRGIPRFHGHYQPHLPRDLGYYDLRLKETLQAQAEMALKAGLHGFCFYHYWFNGKRLMDGPVNTLLESPEIALPFCILWANENWTRTWDGFENDILISQDYHEEQDVAFIEDLGRHFKDERYIRIDGRPLFFIYRPGIIPDAKVRIQKWRDLCEELLGETPLFFMAQGFGSLDPRDFGMDGAVEFPPHKLAEGLDSHAKESGVIDPEFSGHYPLYDDLVSNSLREGRPNFDLIRAVTPSWDNEARKPNKGYGFIGSTPQKYERWLSKMVDYALENPVLESESFVVINAWNEWAEGAHLEPDIYWGSAYLNSTYRAVHRIAKPEGKTRLILVGHDAYKHGAQLLTLNIFKTLAQDFGIDAQLVLLDGGPLVPQYKSIGPTFVADGCIEKFSNIIRHLQAERQIEYAITNTCVTGGCVEVLSRAGVRVISLVHELKSLIKEYKLEDSATKIKEYSDKVVFASEFVRSSFENIAGQLGDKAIIKPQGIYQKLQYSKDNPRVLRDMLGISDDSKVIINAGYADLRKGFDLFVTCARTLVERDPSIHFVWLGSVEPMLDHWLLADGQLGSLAANFHVIPFTTEISTFLQGADVFAMTSREDPFPSVVLESLALGTPVVGFDGGGGFNDLLKNSKLGSLVPFSDPVALADAIQEQIRIDSGGLSDFRKKHVSEKFDWRDYVFSLVELLIPDIKRVSVVVPNFNYEEHISDRLLSIFNQEYPLYEVIVLDDCSTDQSLDVIKECAVLNRRNIELVINDVNSGSVFRQWKKAAKLSRGEYLWVAEADDLADSEFISKLVNRSKFDLAFCDSIQVDEKDKFLADSYQYYLSDIDASAFLKDFDAPGEEFVKRYLSIKNVIMNVSGVVFRRDAFLDALSSLGDELFDYSVAGDWRIYIELLLKNSARICYVSESLNTHRRHSASTTHSLNPDQHLAEISRVQRVVKDKVELDQQQLKSIDEYIVEVKQHLGIRACDGEYV
ncbi:glycoside hydrolase family 99-like domain-containing protein [Microbulbifer guangxiensis]|uniref:glycoside hydrolase family 99-like domain-containing protein n=1 Tax=Microbulbifer guangxiensis TaxID=2904249 RepID=UPI001F39EB1C|nr:glycoside hydrolase family 99-like domain-containing protein [Microbulbifer guangxiensis]